MRVLMVAVTGMLIRVGFLSEPSLDVGNFPLWIEQTAIEEPCGCRRTGSRIEHGRGWVERMQAGEQALLAGTTLRPVEKIGLGQHDAVGDRNLLDRFHVLVERRGSIDRVHHRDHAIEAEPHH